MDHNHCWCAYRNRLDDPLYARKHGNTASGRFASYAGSRGRYSCIPNKGAVASLGERLAQQATSCGQQLSLAVSRTKQIAPFSRDAQDGHYARCYPCRPTRRHAVAVGDLRALPASCTYGPCAVDYPVGAEASSDMLRRSARCGQRGGKGATVQIPGWGGLQRPVCGWRGTPPRVL